MHFGFLGEAADFFTSVSTLNLPGLTGKKPLRIITTESNYTHMTLVIHAGSGL